MADNQFICPPCGEKFHTQQELESHAKDFHSNQGSQQEHSMTCSKCDLKTNAANKMEAHSCETC